MTKQLVIHYAQQPIGVVPHAACTPNRQASKYFRWTIHWENVNCKKCRQWYKIEMTNPKFTIEFHSTYSTKDSHCDFCEDESPTWWNELLVMGYCDNCMIKLQKEYKLKGGK